MTSPLDETTAHASVGQFAQAPPPAPEDAERARPYGPDEERLVAQARAEALLRLARAL
jgi:hypothetical protein